jgi:hypothetical protein
MSLARLLTSGKSLIGLQNPEIRYRMGRKGLLPKFGSDRNPFSAASSAQAEANSGTRPAKYQMTPAELAAARLKETKRIPVVSAPEKPAQVSTPQTSRLDWVMDAVRKIVARIPWRRPSAEAKPAIPNFHKGPVQTELSLDNIKVVRNDLSDADVEIVSAKPAPKMAPTTKPEATERAEETAELIKA